MKQKKKIKMYKTEKANLNDVDTIVSLIEEGRKHIQEYHIDQWGNGYPNIDTIKEDVDNKRGYVLLDEDDIVGYYVVLEHDPCYDYIEGKWIDNSKYVAIHRVVTKGFNKGLGSILFSELKKKYKHIRVDTHEGNISMNKCLLKNDFNYCGVIYLKDGAKRNAYEYIINSEEK